MRIREGRVGREMMGGEGRRGKEVDGLMRMWMRMDVLMMGVLWQ